MRMHLHLFAAAIAISTICSFSAFARGEDLAAQTRATLQGVDAWLGKGPNSDGWDKYLNLAGLRTELAKGDQGDRAVVGTIVKQLNSGATGLELAPFAKLRDAVGRWADELAIVQAPNLVDAVRGAAGSFQPITAADVSASKTALQAAVAKLDAVLKGANGAAWKQFLHLDELQAQLIAEKPNAEILAAIYEKFTADQVGLEMPVFANVADALLRYENNVQGRVDGLQSQFVERLKALAESLSQFDQDRSPDNAVAVGSQLGWLEDMRQTAALRRAVRNKYSQPNLHVAASARLVGAGVRQQLDEVAPVHDLIMGTDIHGKGHTVGTVTAELVPSEDHAMFDTMLAGTVRSKTTGYNGPATIYSTGATAIAGRKRIVLDELGFASYPASATANTATTITGIGGRNLVQRVAWKRVGKQKSEAEQIAADHASMRVRERMDQQVGEQLSQAQGDYLRKVRDPLVRRREFPSLKFRTTKELLFVTGLAANRNQLAAAVAPPEVTVENDLAVRVHESMINNLTAAIFSGHTLTEEEMQKRVIDMRGELPDSLKSEPDKDPWSITFARSQPVTVKFNDALIEITIRGDR
ncbi:MAG TPA: hypothetical protein VFW87_16695, partial [Pirellulales bacterium]|nr:hypothetical protein [Pirellulales bacterium]